MYAHGDAIQLMQYDGFLTMQYDELPSVQLIERATKQYCKNECAATNTTSLSPSRKQAYIILTPLNSTLYIVKLGFTGVYIIFLISAQKHRLLGY